jgi:undecaprenyl-diphosphatase
LPVLAQLAEFDHQLFAKINQAWTNSLFDGFFPGLTDFHRSPVCWVLLSLFIGIWFSKERQRTLKCLCAIALALTLTDLFSFRVVKLHYQRARPPDAGIQVHLRTNRYSGPSFPSNHAANSFAVATVLSFALPYGAPVFFLISTAIAYSRVYVGVHFPLDCIAGALIGLIIGSLVWLALRRWISRASWRVF